jgi:hypothetical protein
MLDSASSQRHRARYLPEPQLIEQLLAEVESKEAGQELPAKRRVEQQVSAGRIHPLKICGMRLQTGTVPALFHLADDVLRVTANGDKHVANTHAHSREERAALGGARLRNGR